MNGDITTPDAKPAPTQKKGRRLALKVLGKLMALVGFMTTLLCACVLILGVLASHVVIQEDGQMVYCDEVGVIYSDSFDDQGRWLKGWHTYTCDGETVRVDEFSSEAEDLGLR